MDGYNISPVCEDIKSSIIQKMKDRGFDAAEIALVARSLLENHSHDREILLAQRVKNRDRQRRCQAAKKTLRDANVSVTLANVTTEIVEQNQQSPNVTLTLSDNPCIISSSLTYSKTRDEEVKELPVKQDTVNQVPVSRARTRARPVEAFFDDWPSDYGERFYQAYPKKNQKTKVIALLTKIRAKGDVGWDELMAGLARYAENLPEWQSWCWPVKWLTEERWNSNPSEENIHARKRPRSGVIQAADDLLEVARRFEAKGASDLGLRHGTGSPHVRLLSER